MEELPFRIFVGVDWGDREHQVCSLIEGKPQQKRFEHSGKGIAALISWLMELCERQPGTVAVAIETPHGVLVDALLEHGFAVFAINPKQLDRFRDRFTVAGAKDDRRDALVLSSSLRTDPQAFRRLEPEDPLILQLREFTRANRNLEREHRRLCNQLRAQLNRFFPQVLQLSKAADEPWVWSLLERFPSPDKVRHAHESSVERILREHRISRLTAAQTLEILKSPPLPVTEGVVEASTQHIALLLPRLRLVRDQRRQCEQHMARLIKKVAEAEDAQPGAKREHRDVEILLSQPGVGNIVAATVLAEAYQPLVRETTTSFGPAAVSLRSPAERKHPHRQHALCLQPATATGLPLVGQLGLPPRAARSSSVHGAPGQRAHSCPRRPRRHGPQTQHPRGLPGARTSIPGGLHPSKGP